MTRYYRFLRVLFFGARTVDGTLCIVDMSLRKYMPKYIKPISNRNKIICGHKICISDMLLQSYLNKWRISKVDKLENLYMNYASNRFLQRFKNDFIQYKNDIFTNNLHIYLRACDAASSYHCPYSITGSNISKWDCIFNCCSGYPRINAQYLESSEQLDSFSLIPFIYLNSIYIRTYINVRYTS